MDAKFEKITLWGEFRVASCLCSHEHTGSYDEFKCIAIGANRQQHCLWASACLCICVVVGMLGMEVHLTDGVCECNVVFQRTPQLFTSSYTTAFLVKIVKLHLSSLVLVVHRRPRAAHRRHYWRSAYLNLSLWRTSIWTKSTMTAPKLPQHIPHIIRFVPYFTTIILVSFGWLIYTGNWYQQITNRKSQVCIRFLSLFGDIRHYAKPSCPFWSSTISS